MRTACTLLVSIAFFPVGCGPVTFTVGSSPGDRKMDETVVAQTEGWTADKVAMVDVSGLLVNVKRSGLLYEGENPVAALTEALAVAGDDKRVKAVILRINSPGGTVTASEAMYREIVRFKRATGKPVVVMMMDLAASGGYYIACAADTIVAYPTTVTGSIGVIVQTVSFKPLLDRWGVHAEAFTSGPNKAAGSPLETMTDEHRAIFRGLVDDFYQRFRTLVRDNRPAIPEAEFDRVTDGRVFTGTDAKALGLVDELGDVYDAFRIARQMGGVSKAKLVRYHRAGDVVRSVYAEAPTGVPAGGTQINLAQINLAGEAAGATETFLYLWRPAAP